MRKVPKPHRKRTRRKSKMKPFVLEQMNDISIALKNYNFYEMNKLFK